MPAGILTFGHSTRPWAEGLALLRHAGVGLLADVRTVPRSRHNPQWAREHLERALPAEGIEYAWLPGLGGLRRARPDSVNTAWQNAAFRGFADYMQTAPFRRALEDLLALTESRPRGAVCLMCAEALPWRCHRSLIADALVARGVAVAHLVAAGPPRPHRLTPFATLRGGEVTYPAPFARNADTDTRGGDGADGAPPAG